MILLQWYAYEIKIVDLLLEDEPVNALWNTVFFLLPYDKSLWMLWMWLFITIIYF